MTIVIDFVLEDHDLASLGSPQMHLEDPVVNNVPFLFICSYYYYCSRTVSHTTKYIHQRDSPPPPRELLGGECIIPKSTQYVTVVTDITQ